MKTLFFTLLLAGSALAARAATLDVTASPYSANGGDTTDDRAAIQNAINDAVSGGHSVYIPSGTYYISSTVNIGGNVTIFGDGENGTVLRLTGATNLLAFSSSSSSARLSLSDLTLTTTSSSAGTALDVSYGSGTNPTTGLVAERVNVKNTDSGRWAKGIRLAHAKNSVIRNCMLSATAVGGPPGTVGGILAGTGTGLAIEADSSGTSVLGTSFTFWDTAIDISAALSNLTIDRGIIVGVHRGLVASQTVTNLRFENGHMDVRGFDSNTICVYLGSSSGAIIRNNLLSIAYNSQNSHAYSDRYHIIVYGSSPTIDGNQFPGQNSGGSVVIGAGSSNPVIRDNIFQAIPESVATALWIQSGVSGASIDSNVFKDCGSSPWLDQGSGTSTRYTRAL